MQNKFLSIQPWLGELLESIKRELRMEHLAKSPAFFKAHFGNRPLNRISGEEIVQVYEKNLVAGDAELADWIVNRWVFKHGDIYAHFAKGLEAIDPNYDTLKTLSEEQSEQILQGTKEKFGATAVYLFSILNEVVFPASIFDRLRSLAERERCASLQPQVDQEEAFPKEIKAHYEQTIAKLQEKWEGKMAGVMKKYSQDIDALKAQIRALQKRLDGR